LTDYIEELYEKRFGKTLPDDIRSLEIRDAEKRKREAETKKRNPINEEAIT